MPLTRPATIVRRLAAAADPPAADPDLVRAFLASRSEAAFGELVRRHGPMVLAVCRRVLGHAHDAEDAFQGAFLVLARNAKAVRGENVAGWLYGVAVRTARGVRLMRDRREKRLLDAQGTRPGSDESASPDSSLLTSELTTILDEELARLPDHYRLAVVLCELQGRSRKDAAAELGIREGTLSSRLAAARKALAERLSRRGVAATAGLLAAAFAQTAAARVPDDLVHATARAAVAVAAGGPTTGLVSPLAAEAARHGMKATFAAKLRAAVLVVVTAGIGFAGWSVGPGTGGAPAALAAASPAPQEANRVDAGTPTEPPKEFEHRCWKRFKSIAGDDAAARKLFAELVADPIRLAILESADADPEKAGELYAVVVGRIHERVQKLLDLPTTGTPGPEDVPWQDGVLALYLGTYPASAGTVKEGWKKEGHVFVGLRDGEFRDPWRPVMNRIFAAWQPHRTAADTVERGFGIAVFHMNDGCLPYARKLAADGTRTAKVRVAALSAVTQFGDRSDRPLFEALFDGTDELSRGRTTSRVPVGQSRQEIVTQARDAAVGLALLLYGKDPAELGFHFAEQRFKRENGRPEVARFEPFHFGFADDKSRAAAHKNAKAWLAEQDKTAEKLRPRFITVIGDDRDSRALFDLILSEKRNVELLQAVTDDPKTAGEVYVARRGELIDKVPNPRSEGDQYVSTAALAGWFYLGTFEGTSGDRNTVTHSFLPRPGRWQASRFEFVAAMKEGPLLRLVTRWAEKRIDDDAVGQALEFAKEYGVKELVPYARDKLAAKADAVYSMNRARAIVVVGKLGDKSDLPVLTKYADDPTYCYSVGFQEPGEELRPGLQPVRDGKDVTTELRDVAMTQLVLRRGGDPRDFGLLWPCKLRGVPFADPYAVEQIGFISKAEREAAHKKAREWLDRQK